MAKEQESRTWWKEAVGYQIYPRSFYDSNGDGIGDIPGIIAKLDYLDSLGVNLIWLNPVYASPNDDNGYDISDYQNIMSEFGTMAEWESLLEALHGRGIRLIMDLVVNHTSDEHPWFLESRSSRSNPRRDYYYWRREPNNWGSLFGGPAWEKDEVTGEYYLHLFTKKQPDLNWSHQPLREDLYAMISWWLDKGIDGFRLDAINLIGKAPGLPDGPLKGSYGSSLPHAFNQPQMHTYLHELNRRVFSRYDMVSIGECSQTTPEEASRLVARSRQELDMIFTFDHMLLDLDDEGNRFSHREWNLSQLKASLSGYYKALFREGWGTVYWANHDFPRAVNRFGSAEDETSRRRSAKMLLAVQMLLPGTPFLYQGDELGLVNAEYQSLDDYRDVETWNHYRQARLEGFSDGELLELYRRKSRDNARAPFPWAADSRVGFTSGTSWIAPAAGSGNLSAAVQQDDSDSVLQFTRGLIAWRQQRKDLIYSDYEDLLPEDDLLMAFLRIPASGNGGWMLWANWTGEAQPLPIVLKEVFAESSWYWQKAASTEPAGEGAECPEALAPWQVLVYQK